MSVGRICGRDVDFAEPGETAWQAAERMLQRSVGTLVVLNGEKEPIGILTDRDLAMRVLAAEKDPHQLLVRECMSAPVHTISEDSAIETAVSLMRSAEVRRLPVVNAGGQLVGVVSLDDVLMLLSEELANIGQLLDRQTPRAAAEC